MKNTKKILVVLFALVALTFVMAISAFAAEYTVSTPDDFIKYISVKNNGSGEGALANDGDTVRLLNNIDTGNAYYYVDKAITIDLNGFTLTTSTSSGGIRLRDAGASLINGKLLHTGGTCALKVWWADRIEDLEIEVTNTAGTRGGIVLQENSTASINTIKNVYIHGAGLTNGIQTYNCGLTPCAIGTMENVTIEATRCALWINANCGTATGCTFKGGESAVEIWTKAGYTASLELDGCTVEGGTQAINIAVQETVGTIDLKADEETTISSESGVLFTNSSNVGLSNSTGAVEFEVPGYNEGTNGSFSKDCVGHEYAVSEIIIVPTCEATGKSKVVCSLCGDAQYKILAALGHDFVETSRVEPTYETTGLVTYTCSACGKVKEEVIPALCKHEYSVAREVTDGAIYETYTCKFCDVSYTKRVYEVSTPDDFIKHISVKNNGSGAGAIANDGEVVRLLNHVNTGNAYYYVDKAITVDLNGFTLTTSTSSGGIRLRNAGASLINGKLLHTGGTCALKVWWADRIEDLEIEVTNTAGTRGGIVLQENSTASINTIKDVYIHGAGLTNGIQTYNCGLTPCAIGTMENVTIEATRCALWINANCGTATGCTFKGGESAIEIWTKAGYTAAIDLNDCSVEGGTQAINIAVQETVGTIDLKADVDTTISSESGVLFTNSSNVGVSNSTGAVEFEVPGYNEGTNGSFSKDCVGHEYAVSEIIIAPTCKAEGKAIVVCSLCGDAQYSKLAVSEHSYETTVTEPTCKDAGYTTHTCSVCGDTYNDNEVPATEEHSYIESGRTETEITYTCDVCGDSYTEEINTHKHTEEKIPAIPSTSKTTGMTSGIKCAECGEILVAPKPAVTGFKVNASLSLGEDISMYINVLIPTENGLLVEGSYVVAEFPEITLVDTLQTITESKLDASTGRYKFKFTSTKAQFMTDTMTFTAYACDENGIESAYNVPAYSMVQYIVGLYQTAKANNDTKQVTLLSDLIELGSATQIFMGYKADTLVTAVAEEMLGYEIAPSTFVAPTNSVAKVDRDGKDTSLVDFRTFGLRLGNVMKPTLYFEDKGDLTGYTVKVFVDGVEQETVYGDLDTLETDANGRRILEISSGIKVLAYDKDIVAKFYDANGNETGSVITISVNSYFTLNYSKNPAKEQAFMRAIYNYGASADAFFN